MVGMFAASVIVSIVTSCGEQVGVGGDAGNLNVGGSTSSTGGKSSSSTGSTAGSTSASNGGSTATDGNACCGGIATGTGGICFDVWTTSATSCDLPLPVTLKSTANELLVEFNCTKIALVNPDAGTADGFYIDYNPSPPHLELTGSYCTYITTNGSQCVSVSQICPSL